MAAWALQISNEAALGRSTLDESTSICLLFEGLGYHGRVPSPRERVQRGHLELVRPAPATPVIVRTDEALIEGLIAGNGAVASELYDRLAPTVDRALFRLFGRRETDHEDLMQATFEQILRTLMTGRFARGCKLTTWAATLASHVGMNALRARRTERRFIDKHSELPDSAAIGIGSVERHEVRSEIERVRMHLAAMDPGKAEAVFLHDVLGHELTEMAVLTGTSVSAAQSRLVRGRKELLERLARAAEEEAR